MRATGVETKGKWQGALAGRVELAHDQRALRRKLVTLDNGLDVLVDLPHTVALETGDALRLEDGRFAEIVAAKEPLYAITGNSTAHLANCAGISATAIYPARSRPNRAYQSGF